MRTSGLFGYVLVLYTAFCGSFAVAQQLPSNMPANTPAVSAASTSAPSASHVQAARDVLIGSGISRSFDAFIPQFIEQAKLNISSTRPELIKDLEEISKTITPQLASEKAEIIELGAKVYANRMAEQELKDIAAFFKTPAGIRYVNTQPQVLEELFGEMQAWSQRLGAKIIDIYKLELKKRGRDVN